MESTPQQILASVRSKDPMEGLCQTRQINPQACAWLKAAVDPFHDYELPHLDGYPDVSTEPTVMVKINQAFELSKPAGLASKANWDCHIFLSPVDAALAPASVTPVTTQTGTANPRGEAGAAAGTNEINSVTSPTGTAGRMDGLVFNSVPSDSTLGNNRTFTPGHMPLTAGGGYEAGNISLDNFLDYESTDLGAYRIVYSGFEVVNTTAQIFKQGAVTVYEYGNTQESGVSNDAKAVATGTTSPSNMLGLPMTYFRQPPNTIAQAKIMPGAHSWAAQDGTYNTAKFQTDNPFKCLTNQPFAFCQNLPVDASQSGFIQDGGGDYTQGSFFSGANANFAPSVHFSNMNASGAYFTGLSEETTLFITWRVGLERLPAANKPTFLALAKPSASYDPNALALYNLIVASLPPGVPQGYNDAGEWFRMVSKAARKFIPMAYPLVDAASTMLTMLGRPALAAGVAGLGNAARSLIPAQQPKSAPATPRRGVKVGKSAAKRAVENFGKPGRKGGSKLQQFSQMS